DSRIFAYGLQRLGNGVGPGDVDAKEGNRLAAAINDVPAHVDQRDEAIVAEGLRRQASPPVEDDLRLSPGELGDGAVDLVVESEAVQELLLLGVLGGERARAEGLAHLVDGEPSTHGDALAEAPLELLQEVDLVGAGDVGGAGLRELL